MIIDAHTHTFPEKIAAKVLDQLQAKAESRAYTQGTDADLMRSMGEAGVDCSVLLPVMTNTEQVEKLNSLAIQKNERFSETGLFSLGGMHPDYENYRAELARIKASGITGIKLHPAYQNVDLDDIRFLRIIERAEELGMAVVIHAGLDIGIMHHNFSSVDMICTVLREINPKRFVLAHMGAWKGWDGVERTLAGEDVYLDTAFVLGRYEPPEGYDVPEEKTLMLSDEQFTRIVEKHGYDKILFGSDSPWYPQKRTIEMITNSGIDKSKLNLILGENAKEVFRIPEK